MYRNLRRQLTAVCAITTGLVLIGMAVASYAFSVRQLQRQSEQTYLRNANAVYLYLKSQNGIDHAWLSQTEGEGQLLIRIENGGKPLYFTGLSAQRELLTQLAADMALTRHGFDIRTEPRGMLLTDSITFDFQHEKISYRASVARVPTSGGDWFGVVILGDRTLEQAEMLNLGLLFAACVLIALACLVLFAWLFTGRAMKPVRESQQQQAEFVSAASHELRSPLAVIRASASAIKDSTPEEAANFAYKIEREVIRLSRLTGDLLGLTGADNHSWNLVLEPTDPQTLLLSVSERFEELAAKRGVRVHVSLPEDALPQVVCDEQRIEQVLTILMDNAMEHTPEGTAIVLAAGYDRRGVVFSVSDSGGGIPDGEKEKIFDRFYRGDASRTDKDHFGLGLSIAREIITLHKGTISVEDAPGGGARFVFTLPL